MNEVRMARLALFAAVWSLTGCEGTVQLGIDGSIDWSEPDAAVTRPRDAAAGKSLMDAGASTSVDPVTSGSPSERARDLRAERTRFRGASRCETLGALLCDDFESENVGSGPDPETWKQPFGYLPTIDGTRAARGSKSLRFSLSGSSPGHIEQTRTFPATRGSLYGRMFVQFGALPTAPASAHWSIVAAMASSDSTEVRVAGQQRTGNRFGISSRAPGDDGFDWHTPATEQGSEATVSSEWTCLEWFFGADAKETRVWMDGRELTSLHLTEFEYRPGSEENGVPWAFPTLERLRIGWWLYPVEGAEPAQIDLWIDEVAIDDQRIGCID